MRRLLILANSDSAIFKFRQELINALAENYHIGIGIPFGEYMAEIKNDRYDFFDIPVNRHGVNPLEDYKLMRRYERVIDGFQPDAVLEFTIKPNLYGSMVCARKGIPCLCNITGLGAVESGGLLKYLLIPMYRYAMRRVDTIFFQNTHGRDFFSTHRIGRREQYVMLPGSGVNLDRFRPLKYPQDETVRFLLVARIIREKGIEEYLYCAKRFHEENRNAEFHICGTCEEDYSDLLNDLNEKNIIRYHGLVKDMREMYAMASCVVLPSFYPEGQSNVLLEGAASCRPLITTDHPGCREAVTDGKSGFLVRKRDADDLYRKMIAFAELSVEQRTQMGLVGREKMESEFDRRIVINRYIDRLNRIV